MTLTLEQHAVRAKGIGGSDIGAVLGVDQYRTPLDVWLSKTGRAVPQPTSGAAEWGNRLEPVVAEAYLEQLHATGCAAWMHECGTIVWEQNPLVIATGDRLVECADGDGWLLEVKTRNTYAAQQWGESGTDDVPFGVAAQVQWYLGALGLSRGDVATLIGGQDFRTYRLAFDAELFAGMVEAAERFWRDYVVADVAPPLTGNSGAEYVKRQYRLAGSEIVAAPAALLPTLERLAVVKAQAKALEREETDLENAIKAAIGDQYGIESQAGRAVWFNVAGKRKTDWTAVCAEARVPAAVIERHTTTGEPSRTFKFTPSKEQP